MKVLVTFAVASEFAPWREIRQFEPVQVDGFSFYKAVTEDGEVRVILTGMGCQNANRAVRTALRLWMPDACISSGLAGGLKPAYRHGRIVVPRNIVQLEKQGLVGRRVRCHAALTELAAKIGAGMVDISLTSPRIAGTSFEKKAMSVFGDVVEMESYAVIEIAQSREVPAVAIRSISDTVNEDLPLDFNDVLHDDGRLRMGRMIRSLIRGPQKVPHLVRFGRSSREAAARLAAFIDRYVNRLLTEAPNLGLAKTYAPL